ncbi:hypothetical protein EHR04_00380 [Leptospira levettii]|uniref:Uncharacterized protein n=1 Tax=Leptospira levettii TaxID=2023178 RepID=A0A5R2BWR3_9LEPT|nr:hypothetical protein [Leptospira levettii]MCW7467402.1 hypothetical protein [Leptospira levettii]MCW7498082.1 hypothetical protein [Leptospira levettii]MCW7513124.1 hypothetical protein [Leptospira levettii]MCW7516742.1 hypothetical protein [Leptospira levettii]TGL11106.1 hypothetical protein EHQ39_07525 [Leptospira levettii]
MNSKNHKRWEELLNDSDFESRIVRKIETKVRTQRKNRNLVVSFGLSFIILVSFTFHQWVIEPNEMISNMSYLVEELSSESIVSLSFD